jgi:MFS family permease
MRRLLLLVAVLVCVDTMLYAALTPLLGEFAREFGLSKSVAGALVAAFPAGTLIGALPAGFVAVRVGCRHAVLAGLAMMAAASLAFGFANDFGTLFAGRLLQGVASSFTWAGALAWLLASAPREHRGELLGWAMAAAVFGALFGPVIGIAAALTGRVTAFSALALLTALLALWALRLAPPPPPKSAPARLTRAFVNARFAGGLALLVIASLLAGVISVLGPLHLAANGWSAAAIGAVWLAAAALEASAAPLVGRLSDARGVLWPIRATLLVALAASLALAFAGAGAGYALLLAVASVAFGALFVPAFTLIADGADQVGLPQGLAFGLMNAFWAIGAAIGPAAAGAIALATDDRLPLVLAAVVCSGTLIVASVPTARRLQGAGGGRRQAHASAPSAAVSSPSSASTR